MCLAAAAAGDDNNDDEDGHDSDARDVRRGARHPQADAHDQVVVVVVDAALINFQTTSPPPFITVTHAAASRSPPARLPFRQCTCTGTRSRALPSCPSSSSSLRRRGTARGCESSGRSTAVISPCFFLFPVLPSMPPRRRQRRDDTACTRTCFAT